MFDATLTLDDASGDDVVFVLNSQGADGSDRMDQASTLAQPRILRIRHSKSGGGTNLVDRHLVSLSQRIADASHAVDLAINFTMAVPRDTLVTNQLVYDAVANLLDFVMAGGLATLTTTNIAKLLLNES